MMIEQASQQQTNKKANTVSIGIGIRKKIVCGFSSTEVKQNCQLIKEKVFFLFAHENTTIVKLTTWWIKKSKVNSQE
eukprot:m.394 g.394  ORF g.394 m.394 type:complete len:77 (+) comp316_c0_seq1:110-340(+)